MDATEDSRRLRPRVLLGSLPLNALSPHLAPSSYSSQCIWRMEEVERKKERSVPDIPRTPLALPLAHRHEAAGHLVQELPREAGRLLATGPAHRALRAGDVRLEGAAHDADALHLEGLVHGHVQVLGHLIAHAPVQLLHGGLVVPGARLVLRLDQPQARSVSQEVCGGHRRRESGEGYSCNCLGGPATPSM